MREGRNLAFAMTSEQPPFLVQQLLNRGSVSPMELESLPLTEKSAAAEVERCLLDFGMISEEEIPQVYAEALGQSWIDLEPVLGALMAWEVQVDGQRAELGELDLLLGGVGDWAGLNQTWCGEHNTWPLCERDGTLHLIAADPSNAKLVELARELCGKAVIIHPAARSLRSEVEQCFAAGIQAPADPGPLADLQLEAEPVALDAEGHEVAPLVTEAELLEPVAAGTLIETPSEAAADSGGLMDLSGSLDELGGDDSGMFGAGDEMFGGSGVGNSNQEEPEFDPDVDVDLARPLPPGPEAQVLRIVNSLLAEGVRQGASDLHLEPFEKEVRVRFRIDGKLGEATTPPAHLFGQVISRLKILAKMDIAEKRLPQDGGITMKDGKSRIDLRVSTVPTCYGEKMVLRVLAKDAIPDNMEFLGLSDQQAKDFVEAANAHHGLMFVTGPTGSGKSTTLYCALNLTNTPDKNIVTVEDPVEYKFFGLNQVPIRTNAGMTFASALRAFLRQDPDVIMVGEVRDTETAQICMRAALTGHLVLSTLHTNSALQVVTRLTDMSIEPFLLGPALRLIEAQRLVRRLCTECKIGYPMPDDVARRHEMEAGETIFRPAKEPDCPKCGGSGYKGRVGIYEVIPIDEVLQEMIARGTSEKDLRNVVMERGIDLIPDSARKKLREGITSLQEVSDYIKDMLAE
jgi:type II secretory ATPase GspE/PulE/Tfp pilus assembly ATPase PilB-like protein